MERLPDVTELWLRSTPQSKISSGEMTEIAKLSKALFGCYRVGDANDPEIYTAAVVAVFSDYPIDIVRRAVDPRDGLPSKCKWLPMIAEIKEFCEDRMEPIRRKRGRDAQIERQLADRADYERLVAQRHSAKTDHTPS